MKEIRMIESQVMLDLNNARQARAEIEQRAEEVSSQQFEEHRQELSVMRSQQEQVHIRYEQELSEEVKHINTILAEQTAARTEYGERISSSLENEFSKVHEAVMAEQKLRFEAEGTML